MANTQVYQFSNDGIMHTDTSNDATKPLQGSLSVNQSKSPGKLQIAGGVTRNINMISGEVSMGSPSDKSVYKG